MAADCRVCYPLKGLLTNRRELGREVSALRCPKDRKTELLSDRLVEDLPVYGCPDCKGTWIPAEEYEAWQQKHPPQGAVKMPAALDVDYTQSLYDTKAALCPACSHYLARAKVALKKPFYVERCPNCQGIWCDRGEWEILERLGLSQTIEQLFTSEWQSRVREIEYAQREQQATIDKLGEELAHKIFELAELLEDHPNGDFGVAYLMRRFDDS